MQRPPPTVVRDACSARRWPTCSRRPHPSARRRVSWKLIETTPNLRWLLLTKRPERIRRLVPPSWLATPRSNVWYGTSVESAAYVERVRELRKVPAVVHEGIGVMILAGRVLLVPSGTHVTVIDPGLMIYEVRIKEGEYALREVFVAREFVVAQ